MVFDGQVFHIESTELLSMLDETWFKSRSHFGRWISAFQRDHCWRSLATEVAPDFNPTATFGQIEGLEK